MNLYFECNSGISGDMAVAALLDAGADQTVLEQVLATVPVKGFTTKISRVTKSALDCCDFDVVLEQDNHDHDMEYLFGHLHEQHDDHDHSHDHHHEHEHHHDHEHDHSHGHHDHDHHHDHEHPHNHHHEHRNLSDVYAIIDGTTMTEGARNLAKKIFEILAESEAKAHGKPIDQVHFHEVGAIDSIVDIISLAVCFDTLSPEKVYVSPLYEGTGTIRCQHGILSIPVPAVLNIVSAYNLPLTIGHDQGEFITPTGAAFLAAVATDFTLPAVMNIQKIGFGAGKRQYERPNMLRCMVLKQDAGSMAADHEDFIWKLESNIDDTTPEAMGFVMERLMAEGARDVSFIPCFMKKNRPAYLLQVICTDADRIKMENLIFKHTTTIGIRRCKMERTRLERRELTVATPWGNADIKQVTLPDGTIRNYPEHESVASLARTSGTSYQKIYQTAVKFAEKDSYAQ